MESLLDLAYPLCQSSPQPPRPDFPLPEEYAHLSYSKNDFLVLCDTPQMGKGWFAARDIAAGTLLMVAKPIAMVMDWQDDSNDDAMEDEEEELEEEPEPRLNELLLLQILQLLQDQPHLWKDCLSTLFPRDDSQLTSLPAWVCQDDDVFLQIESHLQKLRAIPSFGGGEEGDPSQVVSAIAKRLPLIIRYNILSVETCPELLSYPGPRGHSNLSGVALYHLPSFFNHSKRPNCSRWAVGDVTGFYSNQNISQGTQVCISYIEHDVLCESAFRRNQLLSMNFDDTDTSIITAKESNVALPHEVDGPDMPVVDAHVQNELMAMDPLERLRAIEELGLQAVGAKLPTEQVEPQQQQEISSMMIDDHDERKPATAPGGGGVLQTWFQCDLHNLRILKAITLEGLGRNQEALQLWEECVAFVEQNLPPADETLVVLRTQAALCAFHCGSSTSGTSSEEQRQLMERAKHHAQVALATHNLAFGGGVARFRRRYRHDLELQIRPTPSDGTTTSPVDILWPIVV